MQLALWAAAFATGIGCGLELASWSCAVMASAALVTGLLLASSRAWNLALALLLLAGGIGAGRRQVAQIAAPAPVPEDTPSVVVGEVVRGSDVTEAPAVPVDGDSSANPGLPPSPSRAHLQIAVETIDGRRVSARLSLSVLDGVPDAAPGDWVAFTARLYVPRGFANPGLPDGRLLALAQGIALVGCVRSPTELKQVAGPIGPIAAARRLAFRLRQAMSRAINRQLSEPVAGFVRTMVIGERSTVPATIEDGFRVAGATHVLSVSGLHLAVVVALVFQALRRLAGRFPTWALRCPPKVVASILAVPVTIFYTLLTGEALATVRSAVMALVVLGAAIVNRPLSLAASIGAAALCLLAESPASLLDVSFRLSFASVIGLALFARWLLPSAQSSSASRRRRAGRWLVRSLSASFAACLITMPIVAHHFGEITPAAPLGNLVLVPIVEAVVLPFGLAGGLLGIAHPWLAAAPLVVAGTASRLALLAAELFRRYAPLLLVRYPSGSETMLLVAAAAFLLHGLARTTRRRGRWLAAGVAAATLAAGTMLAADLRRTSYEGLRVTFLDVGQGDSALVEGPGGFTALVDGGGRYDASFDTGARIVEPVLRAAGITRLDLVVLSHPHPDHLNGLFRVLDRFSVGALWTNGDSGRNPAYDKLLALARQRGVALPVPGALVRGALVIDPLGPWFDGHIGVPPGLGTNDGSLVVRLSLGRRSLLLVGDIGREGEAELLDRHERGLGLRTDVLKVPHHGSRYASGAAFLEAVSPQLAVVQAGRFNRFGLPSPVTLSRYRERNIALLRTDRDGAVTVTVGEDGRVTRMCQSSCGN